MSLPTPERNGGQHLELRPPETVMRLQRLGSFHQTRISFMRSLLRRIAREQWSLSRPIFDLDERGVGQAIYRIIMPKGEVFLVAFGHELAPEERTDRVIAEKWDATFALTVAPPTAATLERLRASVPLQEIGRCSPSEFVLSRANKSVRLFDHVRDCLAGGGQPEIRRLVEVGYLMRTTAVYGNGKYGLSDLPHTFAGGLFARPFEAEMLTVYLIREFTFDLVEHLARACAPETAAPLEATCRHVLGIGNATGLGMAPFLVGHPQLIGRWMEARETAIARVRALPQTTPARVERFRALLEGAIRHLHEWRTDDARQMARIETLRTELPKFAAWIGSIERELVASPRPWKRILDHATAGLSIEGQELINSLVLEPHGDIVDDLQDRLAVEEGLDLDPAMSVAELKHVVERHYDWALKADYRSEREQHFFWYVSEEKLEPRLGERRREPGAERELRLGIGREVKRLHGALIDAVDAAPDASVAVFLLRMPEYRQVVRRVQALADNDYAEIRENLLAQDMVAVDLLRCKLSMFGAIKFDPKSDRWTRITMYQGAPTFAELDTLSADDWAFPAFLEQAGGRNGSEA